MYRIPIPQQYDYPCDPLGRRIETHSCPKIKYAPSHLGAGPVVQLFLSEKGRSARDSGKLR